MSQTETKSNREWDHLREAELSHETLEPEPTAVLVYECPIGDCDSVSDTKQGFRVHVARSEHDTSLVRATMECGHCGDEYLVKYSGMDSAYCSQECAYDAGRNDEPTVVEEPLEPDVSSTVRYPCPLEGCEKVATSERSFRRHATQSHNGMGRITRDCGFCGATFHERASAAETTKYCSNDCRDAFRRDRCTLSCEECGDSFTVRRGRADSAQFCSYECCYQSRTLPRTTMECSWCGEEIERLEKEQFDDRFCEKSCLIQWLLDEHETHPTPDIAQYEPEELGLSPFGDVGELAEIPHTPPIVSYRITRQECMGWRRAVLSSNTLDVVLDDRELPLQVVRKHVTGDCEHGFDTSVAPVRYNGLEWESTEVETLSKTFEDPSRRGATFD